MVGWRLALEYMRTPPTHFFLESSGRAAYMETYPKLPPVASRNFHYVTFRMFKGIVDVERIWLHIRGVYHPLRR